MNWRIYYDDATTFSDEDGSPEAAPPWGVVAVVTRNPDDPREVTSVHGPRFDYFIWDGREWWGCDYTGLIDRLAHQMAPVVRFGRTISTHDFQRIVSISVKDKLDGKN
jgi:hypothetical protein